MYICNYFKVNHFYLEILSYLCCKTAGSIQKPIPIQRIAEPGDIPDVIVNVSISHYKEHFTEEAWKSVCDIGIQIIFYIIIMQCSHIVNKPLFT